MSMPHLEQPLQPTVLEALETPMMLPLIVKVLSPSSSYSMTGIE
jgi:hypothetical protein